jgi:YD repeat-containing protein
MNPTPENQTRIFSSTFGMPPSKTIQMPAVDPITAKATIEGRPSTQHAGTPKAIAAAVGEASNTVEGPPSIVELARALNVNNNGPQYMYEWVYNNVSFTPTFGLQKGALGCLIDGFGNSFDQSALLVSLLTQAGFVASYVLGTLELTLSQCQGWFGTDSSLTTTSDLLANGGIPNTIVGSVLQMTHCWVQVVVGSNTYYMDPSFKTYTTTTGINLGTALGYNASTFMTQAEVGYSIDTSTPPNWVQDINSGNINTELQTYAENLISYIQTNNPTATLDDVLGGRQIQQVTVPFTYVTPPLSYEMPGDTPTIWSAASGIPTTYKIKIEIDGSGVGLNPSGSPLVFYSDQIYGQRFTLFYNSSNAPVLTLNGTVQATGTAQSYGSFNSLLFTVTHSAYPTTDADQSFFQTIYSISSATGGYTNYYSISTNFGTAGQGMIDYHKQLYAANQYQYASSGNFAEPVMGEGLLVLWSTYAAEYGRIADLMGRMMNCTAVNHHFIGMTGYQNGPSFANYFFDLEGNRGSISTLDGTNLTNYLTMGTALGMHGYALEALAIQQVTGVDATSTTKLLYTANAAHIKIYKGTNANWTGTVTPALTGYDPTDLNNIQTDWLAFGWDIFLPQSAFFTVGALTCHGWAFIESGGGAGYIFATKGGLNDQSTPIIIIEPPDQDPDDCNCGDPVNIRTGDFLWEENDISAGSTRYPYGLDFRKIYNSSRRYVNGPHGYGWRNNWFVTAIVGSDGLEGMGAHSPISAAASITEMYVSLDVLSDQTLPVAKPIIATMCNMWWIGQMTNNVVNVTLPAGNYAFTLLPDGTYYPPPNCAHSLSLAGSVFTLTMPQQQQLNFNSSGQLSTIVFPFGVTVTLSYSGGLLQSVSNGLGRTLTLSYTGTLISGVSNGTASVSYSYDANIQLQYFTDAMGNQTKFAYNTPGQMTQYFSPLGLAHSPQVARVTNTFDTLGRVASQTDCYGNVSSMYLAGSRSQFVDPALNYQTTYFDQNGNPLRIIDELGFVTSYLRDGLGRCTQLSLPEGNSIQWTYDNSHGIAARLNALTATKVGKPGSGLTVVNVRTYDSTYNKVSSLVDGNQYASGSGQLWAISYDPATGNPLSCTSPTVSGSPPSGGTPQISWTYNSRGQVLTRTDETGIVTKFSYDTSTEELLSVIVDYGTSPHLNLSLSIGYDAVGNITSYTDFNGNQTQFQSDYGRRLISITDPSPFNFITQYGYDANSNLNLAQAQTGLPATPWQTYSAVYTLTNKVASFMDPANNSITVTYDNLDRPGTFTDADGRTTTFAYDACSHLYTVTDPTNTISETRTYSNNGLLASLTDILSQTTNFELDGLDRIVETQYPDASSEQIEAYDANDNVLNLVSRSGATIAFTYDTINRLSTKTPDGEPTVSYLYDLSGRQLSFSTPVVSGNPASGTFSFSYDSAGRLFMETMPDGKSVVWQQDSNGNVTQITYPDGYYVNKNYDQLDRMISLFLNGATSPAVQCNYDQLSRNLQMNFGNGTNTTYNFQLNNDLINLVQGFIGSSVTFSYGYNKSHQETSRTSSDQNYIWSSFSPGTTSYGAVNSVNQYPYVGSNTYSYNSAGSLQNDGTMTFDYDTEQRLTEAVVGSTTVNYSYDAYARQIQKTVGASDTEYVYSGGQLIAEYGGGATLQNRYIYGDGGEPLIVVDAAGNATYLHADNNGSIIATSDAAGIVTNQMTYSEFGEGTVTGTELGFEAKRVLPETNLLAHNFTVSELIYHPSTERMLQAVGGLHYNPNKPITQGKVELTIENIAMKFGHVGLHGSYVQAGRRRYFTINAWGVKGELKIEIVEAYKPIHDKARAGTAPIFPVKGYHLNDVTAQILKLAYSYQNAKQTPPYFVPYIDGRAGVDFDRKIPFYTRYTSNDLTGDFVKRSHGLLDVRDKPLHHVYFKDPKGRRFTRETPGLIDGPPIPSIYYATWTDPSPVGLIVLTPYLGWPGVIWVPTFPSEPCDPRLWGNNTHTPSGGGNMEGGISTSGGIYS